jgi:type IV secretory pathway component VirB8
MFFQVAAMIDKLERAKRYLWAFVELGFIALLAIVLIYLLLGQTAGPYVVSVADNVAKFADEASAGLIGIGVILAIVYLVTQRVK